MLGVACDSQRDHPIMSSNESAKGVFDKLITIAAIVIRNCTEHGPKLDRKKERTRLSTTLYLTQNCLSESTCGRYVLTPRVNVTWRKLEFLCGSMSAEFCDLDGGKT